MFLVRREQERHRASEKPKAAKKRRKLPGAGRWPNTEILDGKGSGHGPPTVALGVVLGVCQAKFSLLVSSSEKRKRQKTGQFAQRKAFDRMQNLWPPESGTDCR